MLYYKYTHMVKDSQLIWEAYTTANEGALATTGHLALDVGGVAADLMGGAGAAFDLTNAIWYATEGEYLNAAFSLISMIPAIGDAVGKGGKLAVYLAKGAKVVKPVGAAGRVAAKGIIRGRKAIVTAGPKIAKIQQVIKSNKVLIDGALNQASKNKDLQPHVEKIRSALQAFSGEAPAQPPDAPRIPTS
jgi:hypothetical protein